jgi:hypothetical protein
MSRIEWLKLVMQYGQPKNRARQFLLLIIFESYYQLCKFLDPLPEDVRSLSVGDRILLIWPRLPLSIRLLNRIVPFGRVAHATYLPYSTEADVAARRRGRRTAAVYITPGEFKIVDK